MEPLQKTKVGSKSIRAMAGFIRFLSWSTDRCLAKRVLKGNCYARGCKWIAKQFYSNDRVTTLRIWHRKLQRDPQVQSKTIFNLFYQISRIIPDILMGKTSWKP